MEQITLKTSTVFVAKGNSTQVFQSVDDLPEELRRELDESTNGFNSATILIADRKGREEIMRALQGFPTVLRTRIEATLDPPSGGDAGTEEAETPSPLELRMRAARTFVEREAYRILMAAGIGVALWITLSLR